VFLQFYGASAADISVTKQIEKKHVDLTACIGYIYRAPGL